MAVGDLELVLGIKKARRDLLLALRQSALEHFTGLESNDPLKATRLTDDDARMLRSSAVIFIAEFFFVLKKLDLTKDPISLRAYLTAHNKGIGAKIAQLKQQRIAATPSGLTATRLQEGLVAEEKIDEIVSDAKEGLFRFDQSTLGALLIELMVKQSTNVQLMMLGRTGFLTISGRKPKYISSKGKLEEYYAQYLRQIRITFNSEKV